MKLEVLRLINRVLCKLSHSLGFDVEIRAARTPWLGESDRFSYQSVCVDFSIKPGDKILDVGGASHPFPPATLIMDQTSDTSVNGRASHTLNGRPFIIADVHDLPFRSQSFDFIYCSHVLEHIRDPIQASAEIMRVGCRGYVETPTYAKDVLFAWAEGMHKWHVVAIGDILVFFEYTKRQLEGVRSSIWHDLVFSRFYHPVQSMFYENQDVFNTMLSWTGHFRVVVFKLDGSVQTLGL